MYDIVGNVQEFLTRVYRLILIFRYLANEVV